MKKRVLFIIFISFIFIIFVFGCKNNKFIFSDYGLGDRISNSVDGNLHKINSKFVMFDDAGALKDNIVRINSSNVNSYETAGDYYNGGTSYYKAVFDKIYCSEDFIIVTQRNDKTVTLINCHEKSKKKAIQKYNSIDELRMSLNDFVVIDCIYH